GLMDSAGRQVTVMGGVAGNPADFSGIVFTNDLSSTGGILALIIDQDKIAINGLAVSGWKPAGTVKKITSSEGSWIYTIDNEPAMNVIRKFLGNDLITFNTQAAGLVPLDAGYPLQFQRASGSSVMRLVLLWNTVDQSIMVGGDVKESDGFRFSLPPDFDVIDTVIESTRFVKEKNMREVDALIVFSCVARLGSLGPLISTEIEGLAATWNIPMIGFFSLGEFGKLDDSQCEFHGTTVSWVALKEK
ncbi:MAG: FIST C-terminal domain-containing protein, partial [Ginsengibacter sp.]